MTCASGSSNWRPASTNVRSTLNDRLSAAFKRIDDLEGTRDQQKGAKALVDWLRQTTPWLLAGVAAFAAGLGIKNGVGS